MRHSRELRISCVPFQLKFFTQGGMRIPAGSMNPTYLAYQVEEGHEGLITP